ncbi:amino acid transporter [Arthrobacter sp. MYb211]|uniref:alanine/glycine:cation symporter family protein n=1 Tax=unclassified Arthrobacter TaxID=235627 RepID=UPI000CFBE76A|nr:MULTISPECIES: alanine/glycine:cation symporter family protein [unclassified Arthrobacter]PRA12171.1 amino acid transporter [Arthrobacter sp. MYb221]PRC08634.1 amino acid transporter [Arthrobacter sp. MYb211]
MPSSTSIPVLSALSLDQRLESLFGPFVSWLESVVFFAVPVFGSELPLIVVWIIGAGIFMTCFTGFRAFRQMPHSINIIRGKFNRHNDPGEVTSFQALATELSGTVGLGNIAGVAVAISIGGPGASLWIVIAGFLGMSLKMAEATLGQKYRRINKDGTVSGGPMYYLQTGLRLQGKAKLGKLLAYMFATFTMIGALGGGNLFQANQLTAQVVLMTGGEESFFAGKSWILGVIVAVVTALAIFGGIKSIAKWTGRIMPGMAALYIVCVLIILFTNFSAIPGAFGLIFEGAFTGGGVQGGVVGVAIIGIQRALFSNVAGAGTAGMAHSATKNTRPAQEGFVAAWEPFIDSVVVCTMTALAIIVTGQYLNQDADGIALTTAAFGSVHGLFPYVLTICVLLFAFSTILSFSYYGQLAAGFLFGKSAIVRNSYNLVWLGTIILGSAVSLSTVVRFSDAVFFLMTVPNVLGLFFLANVIRKELNGHCDELKTGALQMVPLAERSTLLGNPISDEGDKQVIADKA